MDCVPFKLPSLCTGFLPKALRVIDIELKARRDELAGKHNCYAFMNVTALSNPEELELWNSSIFIYVKTMQSIGLFVAI